MQHKSLRRYQRMVRKNPGDLSAWCGLAGAMLEAGEHERAVLAYMEALRLTRAPDQSVAIGDLLQRAGVVERAADAYRHALALDAGFALAATRLARLLMSVGETEAAWNVLVAQLPYHPESRDVRVLLALALERLEELEQANEHVGYVLSRDPEDVEALRIAARVAGQLGQLDLSTGYGRRVVELASPPTFDDLTALGVALGNAQRPRDALAVFERAALVAPDRADAHANHGTALLAIGDADGAIRCLSRALALDERNAHARCMLGIAHQHAGRLEEAVDHFRAAAALAPGWAVPLYNAGGALIEMGRPLIARAMLEEAAKVDPLDPDIRAALAELPPLERGESTAGMTGDLETCRLPDLLELLRLRRLSGTLSLATEQGIGQLTLRDGALTAARSPGARRLGDILVQRGLMSREALARILEKPDAESEQLRLGERVLRAGLVPAHQLRQALTEQIVEALRDMLDWQAGHFAFRRETQPSEPNPVLEFDAQSMILDAARFTDEARRNRTPNS